MTDAKKLTDSELADARRLVEMEAALDHYRSCRHGQIECFCTREARAIGEVSK